MGDYGFYGKGSTGYAHYMQAVNESNKSTGGRAGGGNNGDGSGCGPIRLIGLILFAVLWAIAGVFEIVVLIVTPFLLWILWFAVKAVAKAIKNFKFSWEFFWILVGMAGCIILFSIANEYSLRQQNKIIIELETAIENQDYELAEKMINEHFYLEKLKWERKIEQNKKKHMSEKELLLNYPQEFIKFKLEITTYSRVEGGKSVTYYTLQDFSYINTSSYNVRIFAIETEMTGTPNTVKNNLRISLDLDANHEDKSISSLSLDDSILIDHRHDFEYKVNKIHIKII